MADVIPIMTKDNIPFRLYPYKQNDTTILLSYNKTSAIDITHSSDRFVQTFYVSNGIEHYSEWYISEYGYLI